MHHSETPPVTVPLIGGNFDGDGLTRCMQSIIAKPEWHEQLMDPNDSTHIRRYIQLAMNGDIKYSVLVMTLDHLRESRPGANDMFTGACARDLALG